MMCPTPRLPIIPAAPKVHTKDLPTWRHLLVSTHNNLAIWPDYAFDTMISRNKRLGIDSLLVNASEGVRHVLTTASTNYVRPVVIVRLFRPIGGQGVFLSEGVDWRRQRRILAPLFASSGIALLLSHFQEAAADLVRRVEGGNKVNLAAAFQDATLDAVLRALFSIPDSTHRASLGKLIRDYLNGPGRPNVLDRLARTEQEFSFATHKRRYFQQVWSSAVDDLVAERRQFPMLGANHDLLDLLIAARDRESGEVLSDVEVRDQSATMLLAGFETTSRLLFWAAYLLTLDVAEQMRLRTEIAAFPPERVTELDDLLNWPRLRQTLLEALRLYPPIPHIGRVAGVDDVVWGEKVRRGTQVWISPWVIHRHRKFWNNPSAFMPDRFAGKPSPWTPSGPFLPFGGGPRVCIGATFAMAEAQIMLATFLSRFNIALDVPRPVMPVATLTTAPSFEPMFRLERI
jgi:cytochrome P450